MKCTRAPYDTLNEDPLFFRRARCSRYLRKERQRAQLWCCAGVVVFLLLLLAVVAVILVVTLAATLPLGDSGCSIEASLQVNCIPEGGEAETKDICLKRGCCWSDKGDAPKCFYPAGFGYKASGSVIDTPTGKTVNLTRKSDQPSQYGGDVESLRVDVLYDTPYRLHVKICDPKVKRYEVPLHSPSPSPKPSQMLYIVNITTDTFGFSVKRQSKTTTLFSTSTGFIFADQFLQITALLPSHNIYGLGEHAMDHFKLNTNRTVLTLFSRDTPPNPDLPGQNLYGVHPFYMCVEDDGNTHGVFLLNSNAMEVELGPSPSITYRTIGGILDFYFFLGPSPESVVQQYTELVGRPFMPPYWSLGFHLCRWGYVTANHTLEVVERMRSSGIPQDTQWNDIDYMNEHLDFTYNAQDFGDLPLLVENLHDHGQHYVVITDPGISSTQPKGSYPPYDDGVSMNIFITNSSGKPMIGEVWPGKVAFPDFTNPTTEQYWTDMITTFHANVSFDGLWIDMNEPSNFVIGSVNGCPNSSLNNPPFLPGIYHKDKMSIEQKTVCMSGQQNFSTHYNVHSLYGFGESNHTMRALQKLLGTRSLVISRSSFPGSGRHGGHWLGDNQSLYRHMANSITGILDFTLFGIPLVGADICGFGGNTTEELCTRWMQLGAFYPFSRNHNTIGSIPQDPAVFSAASVASSRDILLLRYRMLPFLYTLFHFAHINGSSVARPLFFEFPEDKEAWNVDQQFMWGGALLVTPVLEEGSTAVTGYFPTPARWFSLTNGSELKDSGYVTLNAPLYTIPLHVKGGSIITMQTPNMTTTESRKNPFSLLIALDDAMSAEGWLFWDDGESLETYETGTYSLLHFQVKNDTLTSTVERSGCSGLDGATFDLFTLYGVFNKPSSVSVNGTAVPRSAVSWNTDTKTLKVQFSVSNLNYPFTLHWQ